MKNSIDLLRRLAEVEGSSIKRMVEVSVGSMKRYVKLSLIDKEGNILEPHLRSESVDQLISEGLAAIDGATSTLDVTIYRLTAAGALLAAK